MNLINKRNQVLLPLSFFDRKDKRWKNLKLRLFQIGDHAHRCQNKTRKNLSNFFRLTLENPDIVRTFRLVRTTLDLNWTRGSVTVPVPELQRTHLSAWPAGDFPVGSLHHVTPPADCRRVGGSRRRGRGGWTCAREEERHISTAGHLRHLLLILTPSLCARLAGLGAARNTDRTGTGGPLTRSGPRHAGHGEDGRARGSGLDRLLQRRGRYRAHASNDRAEPGS